MNLGNIIPKFEATMRNPFNIGGVNDMFNGGGNGQRQVGYPDFNPPKPYDYQSIRDKDGYLQAPYKVTPGKLGDTARWQQLAQDQNTADTTSLISAGQTKAKTGADSAWSALAQAGGLDGGARERIAAGAERGAMFAGQDARRQGNANSLNIGLQGEQMNRAGEQFNIGNDLQAQMRNTGAAMQDVGGINQNNQFLYGEQMKNVLGQYQAQAMQNAYNQPKSLWQNVFGGLI